MLSDSIIGIRTNAGAPAAGNLVQYAHMQHSPYVDGIIVPMVPLSNLSQHCAVNSNIRNSSHMSPTKTTSSVTTQTPKSQKRVTIMEPTTHTFDPLLPTMIAVSSGTTTSAHHSVSISTPNPIITITCSKDEAISTTAVTSADSSSEDTESKSENGSINGMLDRITHDLDYLLNRAEEEVPPPPAPPSGCIPVELTIPAHSANNKETDAKL